MPKSEYWCFISYRHADNRDPGRQWATWLHQQIETYEVPSDLVGKTNDRGDVFPERIFPVFRDEDELPADADLASPIYRALERSKFLVVLCSPQAAASAYVADEVRYFKQLGKAGRVLAVLIEGEPNASWDSGKHRTGIDPTRECFPKPLQHPVDPTGKLIETERAEPIAADFRLSDGTQGWTTPEAYRQSLREAENLSDREIDLRVAEYRKRSELAKLKIIAGILGVPLGYLTERDKAYQLEKARRRARVLWRVSFVMILLAALALLAGAFALKREKDARRSKATSDDLSEFMIFDLYQRLIRIGRTDLLDETAGRLDSLLGSGPVPTDQTDCVRYLRLKAQVAKIRLAQGRINEAYQISARTARGIPAGLTEKTEVALAIAGLQSFASDMAIRIGAPDGESLASQAVETFRKHKRPAPLALALLNLIDYHIQRQDFVTARSLAEEAIQNADRAARESASPEPRETLLRILLRQARFEAESGNLPQAINILSERSSRIATFAAQDPDHWLWDREKILNTIEESKFQLRQPNNERALFLAENSLRESSVLESRDPSNLEWGRIAATAHNHRAFILLESGKAPEAKADFEQGLARFRKLTEFSPRNLGWRSSLAWTHDGLRSALLETDPDAALASATTAVDLLRSVYQDLGKPNGSDAARELMMVLTSKANLQTDLGELDAAAPTIAEAVALAEFLGAADAVLGSDACFTQSEILAATSQLPSAIDAARKGRDFLSRIEKPEKPSRPLAVAHLKVAMLEAENAMTAEARASATAALAIVENLHAASPSPQTIRDLETMRTFLLNLPQ
jgi:tetratricopeptide (TPR) repeat protein